MSCLTDIWTIVAALSVVFLMGATYWAGMNHGWDKHKKFVKYMIEFQENWERLA